jgi:hypothetical protein
MANGRCRMHGGLTRGPGTPMPLAGYQALVRWREQRRALGLKASLGGGAKRRSKDRTIARAQRVIEELMMASRKTIVPALPAEAAAMPARPWDVMSKSEKLSAVVDLGLDVAKKILELDVDPDNVRLLAQIKDTALTVISQQIRVDEHKLRPASDDGRMPAFEAAQAAYEEELAQREQAKRKPKKEL